MSKVVNDAAKTGVEVVVLESDMVFGLDHIRAAYCHAKDAIDSGRSASDSLPMETLLYASGERQLGVAIKKMSASGSTTELVVACISDGAYGPGKDWISLPEGMLPAARDRLNKFGISASEIGTVQPGREPELVLERVAAVDILKK
jgi:KEOPS complex subunit Cgi121